MPITRVACRVLSKLLIDQAVVATTCEPCPMCMAALHWARVQTVYYGVGIDDAKAAGFNELTLPAAELLQRGGSPISLVPDVLREQCHQLLDDWVTGPGRVVY